MVFLHILQHASDPSLVSCSACPCLSTHPPRHAAPVDGNGHNQFAATAFIVPECTQDEQGIITGTHLLHLQVAQWNSTGHAKLWRCMLHAEGMLSMPAGAHTVLRSAVACAASPDDELQQQQQRRENQEQQEEEPLAPLPFEFK